MKQMVEEVCHNCGACHQGHATFHHEQPMLQPLPIMGLFYRWGVDLAGPFPVTSRNNKYLMIAVEHYSKYAVVVPIPIKSSQVVAHAFLQHVISHFGASAEVVTDRGGEFKAEFDDLLTKCLIDHRITSAEHPQADGLAERAVQTIKKSLAICHLAQSCTDTLLDTADQLAKTQPEEWDVQVHWVVLGYNTSPQMSTKISPFEFLYARRPVVPPATRERLDTLIDTMSPEAALELINRAKFVEQANVVIGNNLQIAQHRDTLRYARVHGGGYKPSVYRFNVGDFVYLRQPGIAMLGPSALQTAARKLILRVVEVKESGVLVLVGRDGKSHTAHASTLAPCHLMNVDGTVDLSLMRPDPEYPCRHCGLPDNYNKMLICDACNQGYHMYCLSPPLVSVPESTWFCPVCDPRPIIRNPEELNNRVYLRMVKHKKSYVPQYATVTYEPTDADYPFVLTLADGRMERATFECVAQDV